jgi:hypothetical protein
MLSKEHATLRMTDYLAEQSVLPIKDSAYRSIMMRVESHLKEHGEIRIPLSSPDHSHDELGRLILFLETLNSSNRDSDAYELVHDIDHVSIRKKGLSLAQ